MRILLEDVLEEFLRFWERTLLRKGEGGRDLLFHFLLQPDSYRRLDRRAQPPHRIAGDPGRGFLFGPVSKVVVLVRADMFFPAVVQAFQEPRPFAATNPCDRFLRSIADARKSVAIHAFRG